jgi:hypothetical protein
LIKIFAKTKLFAKRKFSNKTIICGKNNFLVDSLAKTKIFANEITQNFARVFLFSLNFRISRKWKKSVFVATLGPTDDVASVECRLK